MFFIPVACEPIFIVECATKKQNLMSKNKVAFLEGRLFSSQSELFENFLHSFDWLGWIKAGPPTRPLSYGHVNRR